MKLLKKGNVYHVEFRTSEGRLVQRSTGEENRDRAKIMVKEAKIAELEMAAKAGALTADAIQAIIAGKRVSCLEAIDGWKRWKLSDVSVNTVYTQEMCLRQFIERLNAAKWPVTRITLDHIDRFVNGDDDATKLSSREQRLATLKSFFKYCTASALCATNPAALARIKFKRLTMAQKEPKVRVPFTKEEYRMVMDNTEGFWKYATALSYWTGLRLIDICCLEWDSILKDELIVWTQKDEDRIALPLSNPLIGGGELFPILLELYQYKCDDTYVFPDQRRDIMDPKKRSKFSVYYGRILERLGIEGKSFHCLRHTFATRLKDAGVTLEQVGRLMGHSDTKITERYSH